jgi:hypothetical protein
MKQIYITISLRKISITKKIKKQISLRKLMIIIKTMIKIMNKTMIITMNKT